MQFFSTHTIFWGRALHMVAPFCSLIACFLNGVLPPYISVLLHTSLDKYYYYLDENFVNFLNCYVTLTAILFEFWSKSVRIVQAFKVEPTH